jgi:hypothetical protein
MRTQFFFACGPSLEGLSQEVIGDWGCRRSRRSSTSEHTRTTPRYTLGFRLARFPEVASLRIPAPRCAVSRGPTSTSPEGSRSPEGPPPETRVCQHEKTATGIVSSTAIPRRETVCIHGVDRDADSNCACPRRAREEESRGDVILFHSRLVHASGPNCGDLPRRAYIVTYVQTRSRCLTS